MSILLKAFAYSFAFVLTCDLCLASVEFPGPMPGPARVSIAGGVYTLENKVLSSSWILKNGELTPYLLSNKLTSRGFFQTKKPLFRIGLVAPKPDTTGAFVGIRLLKDRVLAQASKDGKTWTTLASYPRIDFLGQPQIVRLGKLNLQAEGKNYSGDLGAVGRSVISNVTPASRRFSQQIIDARANEGKAVDMPFPDGGNFVSCHIDRGTDKGMSWSPALAVVWRDGKKFMLVGLREGNSVFNVTTAASERIIGSTASDFPTLGLSSANFHLLGAPSVHRIQADAKGVRVAERRAGYAIEARLKSDFGLTIQWTAELRDDSNYVRQSLAFSADHTSIPIYAVEPLTAWLPNSEVVGTTPGSPVVGNGFFLGAELPGSLASVQGSDVELAFGCRLIISPSQRYTFSSVTGVAAAGQLRRSFLYYIERERARPSSPFLHYNCWYDLGYTVDADKMLDAVASFHRELVKKRGVTPKSYLVDDGWDDPSRGLWAEDLTKFPSGFAALRKRMDPYDAHLGVWISPLGGYGGDTERTADAQKMGLIPPGAKLDLSYPKYKQWFQDRCLQLMKEDGVNAFKWDRAGDGVSPHFMALLDIARVLRKQNRNVFINVTVGTWPSPFWLNHVDSTWRMGSSDVGWTGKGDLRDRWITFRDGYCKRLFVDQSPLYPLNSVMHHGVVNGRFFQGEPLGKTGPHLRNEVRSYFANGTSLQELYLTPALMTSEAWDDVAAAIKWSQLNADVLVDSHWVGGDPLKGEVYGYAAWAPRKGTLMLRNPDDKAHTVTFSLDKYLEVPGREQHSFMLMSPYADQRIARVAQEKGRMVTLDLKPFEVLVFDVAMHR